MKRNIACLLLAALSIIILPLLFAQQDQNSQGPDPEIAALKKRISELESKLQTVENVEKMELAAKLADANAKLANAEFGKFERELRNSNNEWLRTWSLWFVGIIGFLVLIVGGAFWFWLRSRTDQLIANSVEKSLNGFKEAVAQQEVIKNQLKVLEKEQAISALENFFDRTLLTEYDSPEQIRALREDVLLQVFCDETRLFTVRYKAAEVLSFRKYPQLVSPVLELLNSVVDSDRYLGIPVTNYDLKPLVKFIGRIYTDETYQGLKKFLNYLLTEDPKHKNLFLSEVVIHLTVVGIELNMGDAVSILKLAISHLQRPVDFNLSVLGDYFDSFNEPKGIKEILTYHSTNKRYHCEDHCLKLLQKHDPEFVKEWQAEKETTNTQTEESE